MKKFIYVTTEFKGFHHWKKAPDTISFLRNLHRHLFKVRVDIEVFDNDREIEFFLFQKEVESIIVKLIINDWDNNYSCEMIADKIYCGLDEVYTLNLPPPSTAGPSFSTKRDVKIEVSEDGENGCVIQY